MPIRTPGLSQAMLAAAAAVALMVPSQAGSAPRPQRSASSGATQIVTISRVRHIPARLLKSRARARTRAFAAGKVSKRPTKGTTSVPQAPSGQLRFGIYPGGGAGAIGPRGEPIPEDPVKRLAALKDLRAGKRFVLHYYEAYHTPADGDAIPPWLKTQVDEAAANGFEAEIVLRYRPAADQGDVAGFTSFVRRRVRQYGAISAVTALQITNEANVSNSADAADGWYPGARQALVQGVIAADQETRAAGVTGLQIGFNWADSSSSQEPAFFSDLGRLGGSAFAAAVDWVGVDAYPGTWGPELGTGDLASAVRTATINTMRRLRSDLMPLAGLGAAKIRFAENGYPTGDGRTEAMQSTVMTAAIGAIEEQRGTYGVSDYRWFDLRDADTAQTGFESHYGLTRDDYSPKVAFATFRDLVARLG